MFSHNLQWRSVSGSLWCSIVSHVFLFFYRIRINWTPWRRLMRWRQNERNRMKITRAKDNELIDRTKFSKLRLAAIGNMIFFFSLRDKPVVLIILCHDLVSVNEVLEQHFFPRSCCEQKTRSNYRNESDIWMNFEQHVRCTICWYDSSGICTMGLAPLLLLLMNRQ